MNGLETLGQCRGLKSGVQISARGNIAERDDLPGPVRVDAGTCSGFTLQDFDDLALLTRGGENLQIAVVVR